MILFKVTLSLSLLAFALSCSNNFGNRQVRVTGDWTPNPTWVRFLFE